MRRGILVLQVGVDLLFTSVLAFSLFLLFAGHNAPGGGFIGGLVASAGLVLRFAARGVDEVRATIRLSPAVYLGLGLLVASATGLAVLLAGHSFLESLELTVDVPGIGKVKAGTALAFDAGVYLVVVGFAAMLLEVLGAPPARQEANR